VEIQWMQILFQIINFGLIMFVLVKFLYHPIAKVLEDRSQKIKAGMTAAEKSLAEKAKLDVEIKSEIAKAKKEGNAIVAEAKKKADSEAAAIVAAAREQAKKLADNERQATESLIKEAKMKAEADLKSLVAATTAQVLKAGLTESDHRRIIDSQSKLLKDVKFS
jgi:F-type H+-transporting ATPase subunit b